MILDRTKKRLHDPHFIVPDSLVRRTSALLLFDPVKFRTGTWATEETHALEVSLPLMASRKASAVAELVNRIVRTLPSRNGMELYAAAVWLHEFALVIAKEQIETILSTAARIQQSEGRRSSPGEVCDLSAAEAFLILSAAPKLSAEDLLLIILGRPPDALDLLRFEPWFASLHGEGVQTALQVMLAADDDSTKIRVLWFLGSCEVKLEDKHRERIERLANASDRRVKGAALRFACLAGDEVLGARLVNSELSFGNEGQFWDTIWGPNLIVRFSSQIPFESAVRRLHPADAGFALANRTATLEDIDLYGTLLNECMFRIVDAKDPHQQRLPRVVANSEREQPVQFPAFAQDYGDYPLIKDPALTWGAQGPQKPGEHFLDDFFNPENALKEQRRLSAERVQDILSAWHTDAYRWFGRSFSYPALDLLCNSRPDLANAWVEQACLTGSRARIMQLRLGSFLIQLCTVLLHRIPPLGSRLWKALRAGDKHAMCFDWPFAAFRALDTDVSNEARRDVLAESHDDAALSRISYLAEAWGRTSWLSSTIRELIAHPVTWRRAQGLTIASFSNISIADFDSYVATASVEGTWIRPQVPILRSNILENEYAQYWYEVFLNADREDDSWGAIKMMLLCGDLRFFTWRQKYEADDPKHMRRIQFLDANLEVKMEIDREKQRKDTLFGIKIERGEVFPFMNR